MFAGSISAFCSWQNKARQGPVVTDWASLHCSKYDFSQDQRYIAIEIMAANILKVPRSWVKVASPPPDTRKISLIVLDFLYLACQ